jgi:triphosphoribosyl-dephospho-CoA synthase
MNEPNRALSPQPSPGLSLGFLAQVACVLEVTARKAGNVHRERGFDDAHYLDFLLSAAAIAGSIDRVHSLGIGQTVLEAIRATRRVVATNTNLGTVLLLVPLAAVPTGVALRSGIEQVLASATVDDARHVYEAIRLARPGGLGKAQAQDVHENPTIPLREAMRLAAERDLVAQQYANGFEQVLGLAVPTLQSALDAGNALEDAIVVTHLTLLARHPDTLIARKLGIEEAERASGLAARVLQAGWPGTRSGEEVFRILDGWLRARGHARNPGATADFIAAALFAALRNGTIHLPLSAGATPWERVCPR